MHGDTTTCRLCICDLIDANATIDNDDDMKSPISSEVPICIFELARKCADRALFEEGALA